LFPIDRHVLRFGIVGVTSNLMLYLAFLGLTRIGVEHKVAMSFLYFLGVLITFVMNKKWTFSHDGHLSFTIVKYISLYIFGYLINLGVLILMVDWFRYPYDWVQGVMVLVWVPTRRV